MCVVGVLKGISEKERKIEFNPLGEGKEERKREKEKDWKGLPWESYKGIWCKVMNKKTNNNIMKYAKKCYNIQQRQSQEANQMWAMLWLLNWYAAPLNVLMNKGSLTHI